MYNKFLVPPGFKDSLNFDTFIEHQFKNIIINYFRHNGFSLIKKDFTAEQVYNVIKNNYLYRDDLDNHNEPQYKFLVDENIPSIKSTICQ